jgi:conjugative relaxase-like TrwC/TraI family protein
MKLRRPSARYYAGDLVSGREDHRIEPDQSARWWSGRAAAELGLTGEVDEARLASVLVGLTPDGGERLGERERTLGAFDLVLSAPKSVSVLAALAPVEQAGTVERAHELAVRSAVGFLERSLVRVRDRRGGDDRLEPAGCVAAVFSHRTSRALDPHLHAHVVVINAGRDGAGAWRALDARPLFSEARTVGALYQAELRNRLVEALGVRFSDDGRSTMQLCGIDEALRTRFSQRGAEVHRQLAGWMDEPERASPRARALAALVTRPPKERGWELPELRALWARRAGPVGRDAVSRVLERARERAARARGRDASPLIPRAEGAFGALAREVLAAELARGWAPTTFDLERAWCASLVDGATVREIEAATEALTSGRLGGRLGVVALEAAWAPTGVWQRRDGGTLPVAAVGGRWARLEDARALQGLVDIAERVASRGLGRLDECSASATLARALAERPHLLRTATRALEGAADVVAVTVAERDQVAFLDAISAAGEERGRTVVVVTADRSVPAGRERARAANELDVVARRLAGEARRSLVIVPAADRASASVLERAASLAEATGGRAVLMGASSAWAPAALARIDREAGREAGRRSEGLGKVERERSGRASETTRGPAGGLPSPLTPVRDRRPVREVGEEAAWPGRAGVGGRSGRDGPRRALTLGRW